VKLSQVIESLVEERGLDSTVLTTIICEGMKAAYEKHYPDLVFDVGYNKKTDELEVSVQMEVASAVEDEETQISVRKARNINPLAQAGETIWVPFTGPIGRVDVLRAKQVVATKIRAIEAEAIYNEFKDKVGTIVHGVVHKCERNGMTIKLGEALAFLPKSLIVPGDKCVVGFSVRALLKEVLLEPRHDNQLILDRSSSEFLQQLFELEIPEVFERLVEIKKIVRIPGYKSKVAVISHDENIDPVGTCVGVGGVRIRPVLKELGSEKIDIIAWREIPEKLITDALKPAVVNRVEIISDTAANVWVDEDQRSLAIGKGGQNISLASRLSGYEIRLVQSDKPASDREIVLDEEDSSPSESQYREE
jgi:N utilization substance protein A